MKLRIPAAATCLSACRPLRHALALSIPVLSLACANVAQAIDVYTVVWNSTDATQKIKDALELARNDAGDSRIVLEYHSTPWYISGQIVIDVPNTEIWVKGGATVEAKQGEFTNVEPMFRIAASNVTLRGYANFFDAADGVATIKMRKADYPSGDESRHCVSIRGLADTPQINNIIVKGFVLRDSGGDGICINSYNDGNNNLYAPYNVVIKDVTCDNNYRQGISVIGVNKLTVTNCVFKNTNGTAPKAGLDIEPSTKYHIIKDVTFANCTFKNNDGNNIEINLRELVQESGDGPLEPVNITFQDCLVDGGPANGIGFYSLKANGPTGSILFDGMTIKNMTQSGIRFGGWAADHVPVTFNNTYVMECNPAGTIPVIFWSSNATNPVTHGDAKFIGDCHIHESFSRTSAMVGASSNLKTPDLLKDITGEINVHRPSPVGTLVSLGNEPLIVDDL